MAASTWSCCYRQQVPGLSEPGSTAILHDTREGGEDVHWHSYLWRAESAPCWSCGRHAASICLHTHTRAPVYTVRLYTGCLQRGLRKRLTQAVCNKQGREREEKRLSQDLDLETAIEYSVHVREPVIAIDFALFPPSHLYDRPLKTSCGTSLQ